MESLAIFVAIILGIAVFSGPIALVLTWLPVINREETKKGTALIRRIFVTSLTVLGSLFSFMLFTAAAGNGGNLMAIFGSVTALFAAKREYFPGGLRSRKPKRNGFGRRGDRRNGPDGQY
jgi:hypothetical protein